MGLAMDDCIVVGAGPAGLAAAGRLQEAGLAVTVLEARDRAGGRAHTAEIAGQRIDLGAHWFELPYQRAARLPLAALTRGRTRGTGDVVLTGSSWHEQRAFWADWNRIEGLLSDTHAGASDLSVAEVVERYWAGRDQRWRDTLDFHLALECGAPLAHVSARDFAEHADTDYYFVNGGLGALIAGRAGGLAVRYEAAATRITDTGAGIVVETGQGAFEAARAIVAVPMRCLAEGAVTFAPELPPVMAAAIRGFRRSYYERALIHWPKSPLHREGPDRLHIFPGDRLENAEILACVDGSDLHYLEMGGNLGARWEAAPDAVAWRRDFAAAFLRGLYGEAARGVDIVHMTDWGGDRYSRSSWALCAPGHQAIRQIVHDWPNPRLQFAGEGTSRDYWGTVTGAWLEGLRVADAMIAAQTGA